MPDLTRLDRRPPGWRRWAIAGGLVTLAVLAAAAWASLLVFKPYSSVRGSDVAVTITAPPRTTMGDELTYRIRIANDDRVPLARAELEVRPPEGFALIETTPLVDDARGIRWTLGSIAGNSDTIVTIRGRLYGTPSTPAAISAIVLYRPGNFNADFETRADATTVLDASPITLTITGPTQTVPGEQTTYTIAYANDGTLAIPSVRVHLDVPRTFVFASATPVRVNNRELAWELGELGVGSSGAITVRGAFSAGAPEPTTMRVSATIAPNGKRFVLTAQEAQITVLGGNVALIATANDQTSGFPARVGDTLRFRIVARNDGAVPLRSLTARAVFDATSAAERSILNFSAITEPAHGTAVGEQLAPGLRRGTIAWTSTEIPALGELAPGAHHVIDLMIPLHTASSLSDIPERGSVTFHAELTVGAIGDTTTPFTVATTPIAITMQ